MEFFTKIAPILIIIGLILVSIILVIGLVSMLAKADFNKKYCDGPEYDHAQTSGINLTNFVTEINPVEYQQNSSGHNTR